VSPTGPDAIAGGGWQRISIPFTAFSDDNSTLPGGNGVFDPVPVASGGNGQLTDVIAVVISSSGADVDFNTDDWRFSQEVTTLGGRLFDDTNQDGSPAAGELGLPGVSVELHDSGGVLLATTTTDAAGDYSFTGVAWGELRIGVVAATLPPTVAPATDADGVATPNEATLLPGCSEENDALHFAYEGAGVPMLAPTMAALLGLALILAGALRITLARRARAAR
jgi:hypothetical protein